MGGWGGGGAIRGGRRVGRWRGRGRVEEKKKVRPRASRRARRARPPARTLDLRIESHLGASGSAGFSVVHIPLESHRSYPSPSRPPTFSRRDSRGSGPPRARHGDRPRSAASRGGRGRVFDATARRASARGFAQCSCRAPWSRRRCRHALLYASSGGGVAVERRAEISPCAAPVLPATGGLQPPRARASSAGPGGGWARSRVDEAARLRDGLRSARRDVSVRTSSLFERALSRNRAGGRRKGFARCWPRSVAHGRSRAAGAGAGRGGWRPMVRSRREGTPGPPPETGREVGERAREDATARGAGRTQTCGPLRSAMRLRSEHLAIFGRSARACRWACVSAFLSLFLSLFFFSVPVLLSSSFHCCKFRCSAVRRASFYECISPLVFFFLQSRLRPARAW